MRMAGRRPGSCHKYAPPSGRTAQAAPAREEGARWPHPTRLLGRQAAAAPGPACRTQGVQARRAPRCRGTSANRRRTSASIGPRQTGPHAGSAPKPPEVHSRRQRASDLKTSAPRQEPADGQTAGPARSAQATELRRGPETVSPEGRSRPQTLGGQETQRIAIQVGGRLTSITSAYRQYPPPAKPPGESGASSKGPRHLMGPACVCGLRRAPPNGRGRPQALGAKETGGLPPESEGV